MTVSFPTLAAMLRESLPPSTATPSCSMAATIALQAATSAAPSPPVLLPHIQLAEHFTSCGVRGHGGGGQRSWRDQESRGVRGHRGLQGVGDYGVMGGVGSWGSQKG